MKVICDNCRAVYKIPDEKLVKPVNKATCRKCGHRMLIPRPRQGASPDEKTLVTAVPPTPSPAPSRESRPGDAGPSLMPLDDDPENTMPGVADGPAAPAPGRRVAGPSDDVPLYSATPMPTPDRDARPAGVSSRSAAPPPPAPDLSYAGATPAGGAYRAATPGPTPSRRTPAPAQRRDTPPPDIAPPQMIDPSGTPEPARQRGRAPTPQPAPRAARTPTPPPRTSPSISPAASAPQSFPNPASTAGHDPAGDMLVAIIAVCGAMFGALVLVAAFATTAAALPVATLVLVGVGTLLAFGGGLCALFVILTGSRGRRPARPLVSMVLGGGLGLVVTALAVGLFVLKDQMLTGAVAVPGAEPTLVPGTPSKGPDPSVIASATPPQPTTEAATPATATPETPSTATDPVTTASPSSSSAPASSGSGPVAETFEPRPKSSSSGSSSSSSKSSSSSSSSSASVASSGASSSKPPPPDDIDILEDEPEPEPAASNLPDSVPDDVIDTILRNNLDLKKCFFNHKKATGSLPARVTVAFQLEPSGKIRDAGVTDEEFQGTELDACLGRALAAIQMPPSSGASRRVKYPFQLQ